MIIIRDVNINNVHSIESGLLIHAEAITDNVPIIVGNNCTFSNIEQESYRESSVIWTSRGTIDLTE